jgi:transposase-like protein
LVVTITFKYEVPHKVIQRKNLTFWGIIMDKVNYELELNIVLEYLNGSESTALAHKYGVAKAGTILNWVNMYKAYGLKGLIVRNTNWYITVCIA